MEEDIISVIVPIYNTELYLKKCIESIINQTYKNLELILIDDSSTDNSLEICRNYEKIDKRVKVIAQEKKGVAFSRNSGILNATGNFITFVDSDDYIELDMLEKLHKELKENESDIVVCGCKNVDEFGNFYNMEIKYSKCNMNGIDGLKCMLDEKLFNCVSWGKLYKSSLLKNNLFNVETEICEDLENLYKVFLKCNKITYIPDKLYVWVSRTNSITKQKYNEAWKKEILICEEIIKYAKQNCKEIEQYAIKRYIRANQSCLLRIDLNDFDNGFKELSTNLKKYKLTDKKLLNNKSKIFFFFLYYIPFVAKVYIKNRCKKRYNKRK